MSVTYTLEYLQYPANIPYNIRSRINSLAKCADFESFQEDYAAQGLQAMKEDMLDRQFKLNVEYRVGGQVKIISIHGGFQICPGVPGFWMELNLGSK